ncbi:MAG: diaminobutyrate--2-oxoglutarate transaminase [Propionibacteriaceae bacterium]|jgi:diaminobutyrate-2-oxoglutarate transaminase|nr:diaminobutyrate--2-oxoglutarate transaminase [Propionibacteriaceae bacterium]
MSQEVFEKYESNVRSYSRTFPTVFTWAKGSLLHDTAGREFIDFFNGAGALNYGHNPDYIKAKLAAYLESDGIMHALDMYTVPKAEFIEYFETKILAPRGLDYKIMFTGPTGTNAIEAGLKLARKITGRTGVFAFQGGYHGMTLGALALTTDAGSRAGAGVPLGNVTHLPAPYQYGEEFALTYFEDLITYDHSGVELPAALVVETVQAEGGVHVFSAAFLQGLERICKQYGILLLVDDIQVGCARTGRFFSFERAGIHPDIVAVSKSIGGYGMPLALLLFRPDMDIWKPGEHNGTFRGNQLSIVAAKAGLEVLLQDRVEAGVAEREAIVRDFLLQEVANIPGVKEVRGIGLIWGVDLGSDALAGAASKAAYQAGLIMERAGRDNSVLKIMPSLVIPLDTLRQGLEIVAHSVNTALAGVSSV